MTNEKYMFCDVTLIKKISNCTSFTYLNNDKWNISVLCMLHSLRKWVILLLSLTSYPTNENYLFCIRYTRKMSNLLLSLNSHANNICSPYVALEKWVLLLLSLNSPANNICSTYVTLEKLVLLLLSLNSHNKWVTWVHLNVDRLAWYAFSHL